MSTAARNIFLAAICSLMSAPLSFALAQDKSSSEAARTLSKQEVLDLIANKTISYMTGKATSTSDSLQGRLQTTFKKTDASGGTLVAYAHGKGSSSSSGKWYVAEDARLVRQYERVQWGDKPYFSSIVEKNGKYFVRFGAAEDHEIIKIE
jgi:hypothetical protein